MNVFTESTERAMVVDTETSWFERTGTRLMAGIQIGSGQISLANVVTLIAVAAMIWFGATVTSDHDQINKIPSDLHNIQTSVDDVKLQMGTLSSVIAGFQRDLAETKARLDCIQGVGTVDGCSKSQRRRFP